MTTDQSSPSRRYVLDEYRRYFTEGIDDPDEAHAAHRAVLEHTAESFDEFVATILERGAVISTTITFERADGTTSGNTFQALPTPGVLLFLCGQNAEFGDKVTLDQVVVGGHRCITEVWPFSMEVAEAMTRPAKLTLEELTADGNSYHMIFRNLGRFGKVARTKDSGPPTWLVPRIMFRRSKKDDRGLSVTFGWLQTSHNFHWFPAT